MAKWTCRIGRAFFLTVVVLALVALPGCTGTVMTGKAFDDQTVSKIERGKTTREDVRRMFGEPVSTRSTDDGEVWSYYYSSVMVLSQNHSLDVDFDKRGIVRDYRYKNDKSI